ncbi:MAG: MerR family DNA-binding transcriptional regulator [Pseudomonadota bacterium]
MTAHSAPYSISDLSRIFEVTPRTIRFYEDQGLISPQRVDQQRVYSERDFVRLKLILRGKRIGFSLAELKTTLDLYDNAPDGTSQADYVLGIIKNHRRELEQKRKDIEATLEEMEEIEARITHSLSA